MDILKLLNAPLGFCLEIGMYIAYALWAYSVGQTPILKWVYAIVLTLSIAIIWGIFASPDPAVHLNSAIVYMIQILLFLCAALLLYLMGRTSWAIGLAVLSIASTIIAITTKQ